MLPDITVLGRTVSVYALMAVTGVLAGLALSAYLAKRDRLDAENAVYLYVLSAAGMLVGAKVLYWITVFPLLIRDLPLLSSDISLFSTRYLTGGMVFFGGLLGAVASAFYWAKKFDIRMRQYIPALLPSVPLVACLGRIGCLSAGCCYGVETQSPIHVVFHHSLYAPNDVPLVPTQLYEAVFQFMLFLLLVLFRHHPHMERNLLTVYLVAYCAFRFVLEFFRGDVVRGHLGFFSTSQWISLGVVAVCILLSVGCAADKG